MIKSKGISFIIFLIGVSVLLLTIYYFQITVLMLIEIDFNILFLVLNITILFFEILTAVYGIFLIFHIAYIFIPQKDIEFPAEFQNTSLVSLIIPTYNPDLYAVETNLLHLQKLTYKNIEIIITDNSDNPKLVPELKKLCEKFNVTFVHREGTQGFKARNLNLALSKTNGKYFFIVDIDQSIKHNSIEKMVYAFENSTKKNLAFIQGNFEIKNANNIIRTSLAILYTFFHYVISLAKSIRGTVLFNGNSACFKTDIIKNVGGFPEYSYTEDIEMSYNLLLAGYSSTYLNITVTSALVFWKISNLISSFWRWSYGGTSVLRNNGKSIITSNKISWDKKIELFLNGISFFAFSGILIVSSLIGLMYLGNIELLRPYFRIFENNVPLILIVPAIISISHILSCVIGLIESNTKFRLPYLIPYSLASISISFFVILPTFYSLFRYKNAESEGSKWNNEISKFKTLLILLLFSIFYLYLFFKLLVESNFLWITFAYLSLTVILTVIFLIKDRTIDESKENYAYFKKFRKENSLTIDSEYNYLML